MTTQANQSLLYVSGRASFPWIADPQEGKNDKGEETRSYNLDILFPPNSPDYANFMQLYQRLAVDAWKDTAQGAMASIQNDRKKRCYGAGEEKVNQKTFQVHPGYAGNVFISARSSRQPQIIGADGKPVDPANSMALRAEASRIYGGCYVNAVIKPWLQKNAHGVGVRCDLIAIQFREDGESFGAGPTDVTGFFAPQQQAMPAAPFPSFMGGGN